MYRFLLTAASFMAALCLSANELQGDVPFGWGSGTKGGDEAKTVVLQSNGL